jgi:hypothetical protein
MQFERFFFPSSEITRQLIARIGHRRSSNLRAAIADYSEEPESGDVESDELLTSVLAALEDTDQRTPADDREDRRWLSEIVYHLMGRLARQGSNRFSLTECVVEGMSVRLGLRQPADAQLLHDLAREFSAWLTRQEGQFFVAGWGKIVGSRYDPDSLSFKPLARVVTADGIVSEPRERQVAAAAAHALEAELDLVE